MRWHLSAFLVLADTCVAMAEPKLSTEEAARRAAIQDQIGNRCPLVEPDYTMRLMLATQYKNSDPLKWGNAYAAATKEMVDKFESVANLELVEDCCQMMSNSRFTNEEALADFLVL